MRVLLGIFMLSWCCSPVWAVGKEISWWEIFCPPRLSLSGCCPDDYASKPAPCLPPIWCPKGCDDYREKPLPWLPPEYCPKGCDDYVGKPLPGLPCDLPWMKCYKTDGVSRKWLKWPCPWWGPRLCPQ